jgi:hypothetical protein
VLVTWDFRIVRRVGEPSGHSACGFSWFVAPFGVAAARVLILPFVEFGGVARFDKIDTAHLPVQGDAHDSDRKECACGGGAFVADSGRSQLCMGGSRYRDSTSD